MRTRILEATIRSLHVNGYAATTTLLVAKEAKVTRGAMLHHFATKVDLMLFVVQAVYEEELELYRKYLVEVADLEQRRLMLPKMIWDVLSRPSGVAVLEILQGSRSDAVLAKRLGPLQAKIERDSIQRIEKYDMLASPQPHLAMVRLLVWAVRGLSIANVLVRKPSEIGESVELLSEMLAHYYVGTGVMTAPQKKGSKRAASGRSDVKKGRHQ
nr:TetR/AcrR family transcriptional regulator [Dyella flava]